MIELHLENLNSRAALFNRFEGQTSPQPAFVEMDERGLVSADSSGEIGSAVLESVWHGRTLRFEVPSNIDCHLLREFLQGECAAVILARIHSGHRVEWDGSNMVGHLDDQAIAAADELHRELAELEPVPVYEADDLRCDSRLEDWWPPDMPIEEAARGTVDSIESEGGVFFGDAREALIDWAAHKLDEDGRLGEPYLSTLLAADKISRDRYESVMGEDETGSRMTAASS